MDPQGASDGEDASRVFLTLAAALEAVDFSGHVVIRRSGLFHEALTLRDPSRLLSTLVLEGAPGTVVIFDGFDDAEPASSKANQARLLTPAITLPDWKTVVVLRNLTIRNWLVGIDFLGKGPNSRLQLEDCRLESCLDYGVRGRGFGRVVARHCTALDTGLSSYRSLRAFPPFAGVSFQFEDQVAGLLADNLLVGAFHAYKAKGTTAKAALVLSNNVVADRVETFLYTQ